VNDAGGNSAETWFVYIVECRDGSLYCGITNDIDRREREHNEGTASRYTRARRPVRMVYSEPQPNRSAALIREFSVKLLSRKEKQVLVASRR
jgi:predicted GIY-YIG superfamily endonuclease